MAVAMIRPEPESTAERGGKGGRGKKLSASGQLSAVPRQRLSDARAVLAYSRELAEAVMRGDKTLKAALADARQGQGDVLNARSRLAKLRDDRPDLAELVVNEALSLDEAVAKARDDAETLKQQRWAATMNIIDGARMFDHAPETAVDKIAFYDPALAESRGERVTPARPESPGGLQAGWLPTGDPPPQRRRSHRLRPLRQRAPSAHDGGPARDGGRSHLSGAGKRVGVGRKVLVLRGFQTLPAGASPKRAPC
jgi:hypothetical protein